ncbi:hypothetical protein PJI17_32760, partial [Mycobacterium kansasii]
VHGLNWALIAWFFVGALMVVYLEYRETQRRGRESLGNGNWVLGNSEDDDSVDLLHSNRTYTQRESHPSDRMEVQLEPIN